MAEKTLKYTFTRHEYGGPDPGLPVAGVMQVYYERDAKYGDEPFPSMVDFMCPCGCGNTTPTHLTRPGEKKQENDRHWEFEFGPNGPTLRPSIRWRGGCKAHFTITDGAVHFHDSGK